MSSSTLGQTSTPSSDFKSILDAALSHALSEYEKTTGNQLLSHPLATQMKRCDSVDAILAILRGQAEAFQQFRDGDHRLMMWISPVVDILYTFSDTLGGVAGMAFPPAGAIFTGIGVLLAAARGARASHDALVELFGRIESFFKRLEVYTQISLTAEMVEVFVKIVAEVLYPLHRDERDETNAIKKLLGRTDIEDALKRLDSLIQEEVRMAIAQTMRATFELKCPSTPGNQIEQDVRKWFSPPDPSTNHNTACEVYHKEPPTWLFGAGVFKNWMSDGSLLWIHGKRMRLYNTS
ncbi:hypothetical protein EDB83DRAFT_2653268 [Lactarius deliciosus]|nr:hypothetical protein EDB83DRAFT_2653268 [Lactarius deliciosus]